MKIITMEGFEDFRGEFDTGIFICKPIVDCIDASTIENVIEDYCIDVYNGDAVEGGDYLDRKAVLDCFYKVRKKKVTPNFRYWKAVIEIYPENDKEIYQIIEKEGF